MQIDTTVALSQFVGSLPTFIAVILAWIQSNARIGDAKNGLDKRIDDTNRRFDDVNRHIDDKFALLSQQMKGMEDNIMRV